MKNEKDRWLIKICCITIDIASGSRYRQIIEQSGQIRCTCGKVYELRFYKNEYHHIYCGLLNQSILDGKEHPELNMYKQLSESCDNNELLATPYEPIDLTKISSRRQYNTLNSKHTQI